MILLFKLILGLTICLSSAQEVSYEGFKVHRVKVPTDTLSEQLRNIIPRNNFWSHLRGQHADVMVVPKRFKKLTNKLRRLGFEFSVMIDDVSSLIEEEKVSVRTEGIIPSTEHPMAWTEYHPVDDFNAYLAYLEKTYPSLVFLELIGQSYQSRNMTVVKICQGGCETGNKPALWIDGGIHAREWIASAVVSFMIHKLVEDQDNSTKNLLEKLNWYFLPIVNPDGYEYSRNSVRMWRKTMSNFGKPCFGVDANRNYGFHFGGETDLCSDIYPGTSAFSEVEIQNVRDFIVAQKKSIKFVSSIHSYSQLILLPWAYTELEPPTYAKMKKFADTANVALEAASGVRYKADSVPKLLYLANGTSMDWTYVEVGIPYSISMELRDSGQFGFILPPEQIIPTGEEVWAFHKSAANQIISEFGN